MNSIPILLRVLLPALSVLALAACTPGPGRGTEARAHFLRVAGALQAGSLAQAYSAALTPSQQADVNALWIDARELVTAEDFAAFQAVLKKAGPKLASLLAVGGSKTPSLGVLASKAKDLPAALGLKSFEGFRASDAKGLLEAIDQGLTSDLLKAADVKARLDSLKVTVVAEEGDWARLRFTSSSPDGETTEEVTDVIRAEGNWLPTSWVSDWEATIAGLKAEIARLKEVKQQDPDLVRKAIADLDKLLDDPAALMGLLQGQRSEGQVPQGAGGA